METSIAALPVLAVVQAAIATITSARMAGMGEIPRSVAGVLLIIVPAMVATIVVATQGASSLHVALLSAAALTNGSIAVAAGKMARMISDHEDMEWMKSL